MQLHIAVNICSHLPHWHARMRSGSFSLHGVALRHQQTHYTWARLRWQLKAGAHKILFRGAP